MSFHQKCEDFFNIKAKLVQRSSAGRGYKSHKSHLKKVKVQNGYVQKLSLTSIREDLIALTAPIVLNDFLTFLCTMKTKRHSLLIHNDKVFVAESGLLFSCR